MFAEKMAGIVESLQHLRKCIVGQENASIAEECVFNITSYFEEELSVSEINSALATVFEEHNGLLPSIVKAFPLKLYKSAVVQTFCLLKYLLVHYHERVTPFVVNIKDFCQACISRNDTTVFEKEKAYDCLHKLIDSGFWGQNLNLVQLIKDLILETTCKNAPKVSQRLYHILGTIARYFPENMTADADKLFRIYVQEIVKHGASSTITIGCLDGLADYLHTFSQPVEDNQHFRMTVYSHIKQFVVHKSDRKLIQRAALKILQLHGILFKQHFYEDYIWWHQELINNWMHVYNPDYKFNGKNVVLAFYEVISIAVDEDTVIERAQAVLKYFMDYFKEKLLHLRLDERENVLQGVGKFSQSYFKYTTEENIQSLFTILMQQVQQLCSDLPLDNLNETNQKHFKTLPYYVITISSFLKSHKCSELEVSGLQFMAVVLIYTYGVTPSSFQSPIVHAVMSLISSFAMMQGLFFDGFIDTVVYQSTIRICSSPNYEKYVSLWNIMTDAHHSSNMHIPLNIKQEMINKIYDAVITTTIQLIKKLDLKLIHRIEHPSTDQNDSNLGLQARNPHDFKVFINLVEFITSWLELTNYYMFKKWVVPFVQCMIVEATKTPIVSGFYKLLALSFYIGDEISCFKDDNGSKLEIATSQMICKCMQQLITIAKDFKGDLQISCVRVFLKTPVIFLPDLLIHATDIFQIAFKIGRTYLKLAAEALATLEKWRKVIPPEKFHPILQSVLPELEPFLCNQSAEIGLDRELEYLQSSRYKRKRFTLSRKKLVEIPDSELLRLQKSILQFLGPLEYEVSLSLLNLPKEDRVLRCCQSKKLKMKMPFKGMTIFFYLDSLLPCVVELSLKCSERQTRIESCELFQAIILFILGTSKQLTGIDLSGMDEQYENIFIPILLLGCDSDQVVSQLFNPLVYQLAHWYSSPQQLRSKSSEIFLNVLLDSICHPSDSSLRDMSSKCLKEFVEWSVKQHTSHRFADTSVNIEMIISRLCVLCGHPSAAKRLGGALAFNSIYKVLRENESVINEWFIVLLYAMVKNLTLLNSKATTGIITETELAVDHVFRVLRERSHVFNKVSIQRKKPPGFNGVLLYNAVVWLLFQCQNTNKVCRAKCMDMICVLAPLIEKCESFDSFIKRFIDEEGQRKLVDIIEGVQNKSSSSLSLDVSKTDLEKSFGNIKQWLLLLQSSLDCYVWLLKNSSCSQFLLRENSPKIICAIELYLELDSQEESLLDKVVHSYIDLHAEYKEYMEAKSSVVIYIFDFLLASFKFQENAQIFTILAQKCFSSSLLQLLSKCIFNPELLGFDPRDGECLQKFHSILKVVILNLQTSSTLSLFFNNFCDVVQNGVKKIIRTLKQNSKCFLRKDDNSNLEGAILGIIAVQESGISILPEEELNECYYWFLQICFEAVVDFCEEENVAVHLEPVSKHLGELILQLACRSEMQVNFLINSLLDCTELSDVGNRTLTHGEFFQATFKNSLKILLLHPETTISVLLKRLETDAPYHKRIFTLLEQFCQVALESRTSEMCQKFYSSVLDHWHLIEIWARKSIENTLFTIQILKLLGLCAKHRVGCLSAHNSGKWITSLISETPHTNDSLELRNKAIELLPYLIPSPESFPDILKEGLQKYCEGFPDDVSELQTGTFEYDNYVFAFCKLLSALQFTGSLYLLQKVIALSVYTENHICREKIQKTLPLFMMKLDGDLQCKAIEVSFNIFLEKGSFSPQTRLNCVFNFVLPLIKLSLDSTIINFFTLHLRKLLGFVEEKNVFTRTIDIEHNIVSKMCSWSILEALFSSVSIETLESAGRPISNELQLKKGIAHHLTYLAYHARTESLPQVLMENLDVQNLFRKMQCTAFVFLIVILVSSQKNELIFYTGFIFKDYPEKSVWDKVVDCTKTYSFPVCWERIPSHRKMLVNIRKSTQNNIQYLATETQLLVNSTLAEDVTHFDLSTSVYQPPVASSNLSQRTCVEVSLEDDIINKHECMSVLCALLRHMTTNKIYLVPEGNDLPPFPSWMREMQKILENSQKHANVRAFLTKLILNNVNIFKPYARFWLYSLMQVVAQGCFGYDINYMVVDVISLLASWHQIAIPSANEAEKLMASEILKFLVVNAPSQRRDVLKYNLDIIRTVVEVWKSCLTVPHQELLNLLAEPSNSESCNLEAAVHIIGIFLANGIQPWNNLGKQIFFTSLVTCISPSSKLLCPSSEVVGMCFKYLNPHYQENIVEENINIFTLVKEKVYNLDKTVDKYLHCLYSIQKHYPPLIENFIQSVLYHLPKVKGKFKVMCLEIICAQTESLGEFAFNELESKGLLTMLHHADVDIQRVVLLLIKKLLPQLPVAKQEDLIKECVKLTCVKSSSSRVAVLKILMWAYDHGVLCDNGKAALLKGMVDSDSDIREIVFNFWNDKERLPSIMPNRFLSVLGTLYSIQSEQYFLNYSVSLLLHEEMFGPEYNNNIFDHPLAQCDFKKLDVLISERKQNSSFVPLFSQLPGTSQINQPSYVSSHQPIQATRSLLAFQPTVDESTKSEQAFSIGSSLMINADFRIEQQSSVFKYHSVASGQNQKESDLANVFKSRRLVKDRSHLHASIEARRVARRQQLQQERVTKRELNVSLLRSYRSGDFPDIEIPFSCVFKPLLELSKHNASVASQLMISIFSGITADLPVEELPAFYNSLISAFCRILENTNGASMLVSTIFEMILLVNAPVNLSADLVVSVSQESGLLTLGSLVLEKVLINWKLDNTGASNSSLDETNYWLHLAELYQNMEEWEVVLGIFHEKINSCNAAKTALEAESEGNWKKANDNYRLAWDSNDPDEQKQFYYEAMFRCLTNLSKWNDLSECINDEIDGDLDLLWNDENLQQLLPQFLTAKIQLLKSEDSSLFLNKLKYWMQDDKKLNYLQLHFAEELAVACVMESNFVRAQLFANKCYTQFLNDWINTNTLGFKRRAATLCSVHRYSELHEFLEFACSTSPVKDAKQLESYWKNSIPKQMGSLIDWDKRLNYRSQFIHHVKEEQPNDIQVWSCIETEMGLAMVDAALAQSNYSVATKYMLNLEKKLSVLPEKFKLQWNIEYSRCIWLKALQSSDVPHKIKYMLKACKCVYDLHPERKEEWNDILLQMKACGLIGLMTKDLWNTLKSNPEALASLDEDIRNQFQIWIGSEALEIKEVLKALKFHGSTYLQSAVRIALEQEGLINNFSTFIAKAYYKIAEFYYATSTNPSEEVHFMKATFQSMRFGSMKALYLFPHLLQNKTLDPDWVDNFISESAEVTEWMFIKWISQILACLDKPIGRVLFNLVVRIAEVYPQAMIWPYNLSREKYKKGIPLEVLHKLDTLLLKDTLSEMFLKAMSFLAVPEKILLHHINQILNVKLYIASEEMNTQCRVLSDKIEQLKTDVPFKGSDFQVLEKYYPQLQEAVNLILNKEIHGLEILKQVKVQLETKGTINSKRVSLQKYSPWLNSYQLNPWGDYLELPGQYTGNCCPIPHRHVRIAGFCPEMQVMRSQRQPFKLTIIGNDGKEYPFLVKYGEDLRQDQRIQQLFDVMNTIFSRDRSCLDREIKIFTYQVVPLTSQLGIIQWIEGTKTLTSMVKTYLNDEELKDYNKAYEMHCNWLKASTGFVEQNIKKMHIMAYKLLSRRETVKAFYDKVKLIPWDIFRRAFIHMSVNKEDFFLRRQKFASAYASMCVSHWILGIGDRHPGNCLVRESDSSCIGIDFGYAFGCATQFLPVPELMPFRMTPHIVNLMQPFETAGLLEGTMMHCLNSLRNQNKILLATMEVFVHEPSINWIELALAHSDSQNQDEWFPQEKLLIARNKLEGANPTAVVAEELKTGHKDSNFLNDYLSVLHGIGSENIRARCEASGLSPSTQVKCLIDLATDPHLLGKTWCGWEPWV